MSSLNMKMINIRSRAAGLRRELSWGAGRDQQFFNRGGEGRILAYHGVCLSDPLRYNTLFLSRKSFEAQLKFYKKYFHVVSLNDFYQQKFRSDRFTICLTFDDGFENNFQYVLPLLEQYELPATFFVTAIRHAGFDILWNDHLCLAYAYGPQKITWDARSFVKGKDSRYVCEESGELMAAILRTKSFEEKLEVMRLTGSWSHKSKEEYWKQMSEEQLKAIAFNKWVSIGSHSYCHNDLAYGSLTELRKDLAASKRYLEDICGKEITSLAFPYGSYKADTIEAAKQEGFNQLLTTSFLNQPDRQDTTMRERLIVNPFISTINQMFANVNGYY